MDQYNSDIAREVLSKAETELVRAQGYLVKSDAPEFINLAAQRILRQMRKLQDEINRLQLLESK